MTKSKKGWAAYLISFGVSYVVGWWLGGVISKRYGRHWYD